MSWLITKYAITAFLVVFISEVAKRNDKFGGLIAALPLVTLLTLIWLYIEKQPLEKIANHAWYTFWYVLPTLPMFLIFPKLLAKTGFFSALLIGSLITVFLFYLLAFIAKFAGINLI